MADRPPPGRLGMGALSAASGEVRLFARRLAMLGVLILGLLAFGTVGFMVTEDTSLGFSFLWSLDTIATIGSIPDPDETGARIVKVILIVLGVGTLFYALVTVTEFFVAGRVSGLLAERRVQRMIDSLSDHYLICGFGRVGRQVARDMRAARQQFVVVDSNPNSREIAEDMNVPFIEGPPSEDDILRRAGLDRARGLIACMDDDAENIFTTLTARELRGDLTIIARAGVSDSEQKLLRAGADRVVSPYKESGAEMARLVLSPQVADVVQVGPEYRMEEIEVTAGCAGAGRKIDDVRGDSIVVALRRQEGTMQPLPPGETIVEEGDVMVAMGSGAAMDRLEDVFAPSPAGVDGVAPGA